MPTIILWQGIVQEDCFILIMGDYIIHPISLWIDSGVGSPVLLPDKK